MADRKKLLRLALLTVGTIAAVVVAAICVYRLWERAPETAVQPEALVGHGETEPTRARPSVTKPVKKTEDEGLPFDTQRRDGIYTILLVGNDDGTGNTDTIMVGRLDTVRHTMDFVSIPRDTIINVDWQVRKLNGVYWGAGGIDALKKHIRKLIGFDVDCYAVVDLAAFEQVVDAVGGIWFEVPQDMYYEGWIELDQGYQMLNGHQAMGLCRYRADYADGDLGRIEVQHDFLKAAAEQLLSLDNIPNAAEVIRIVAENTTTNLSAANIAWFLRQAMLCRSEDINFHTAPNTPAYVRGYSYAFLDLYDWLAMVNERLDPFDTAVTEADIDLVYLYNGKVCCTTVLQGPGYYDLGKTPSSEPPAEIIEEPEEPVQLSEPVVPSPPMTYEEMFIEVPPEEDEPTEDEWFTERLNKSGEP